MRPTVLLLLALIALPRLGFAATPNRYCLPPAIGPAMLACYTPVTRSAAETRMSPQPVAPIGTIKRLSRLPLEQVMLFLTESAPPSPPQPFRIDYLFGTGLQAGPGGVTIPGKTPKFLIVAELAGGMPDQTLTRRELGALHAYRIHALASTLPWTVIAPLPGSQLSLTVTGNLSKQRVQAVARAIVHHSSRRSVGDGWLGDNGHLVAWSRRGPDAARQHGAVRRIVGFAKNRRLY